jgi:hypothetical protein
MHCKEIRKISVSEARISRRSRHHFMENCKSSGVRAGRCPGYETGNETPEMNMEMCWRQQFQKKAMEGSC